MKNINWKPILVFVIAALIIGGSYYFIFVRRQMELDGYIPDGNSSGGTRNNNNPISGGSSSGGTGSSGGSSTVNTSSGVFPLKKGSKGAEVKKVQQWLMRNGYDLPIWGADGIWGNETQRAWEAAVSAEATFPPIPASGITESVYNIFFK